MLTLVFFIVFCLILVSLALWPLDSIVLDDTFKRKIMDDYMTLQALEAFNNSLTQNANVIMAANTSRADRNFSREMSDLAWERNLQAWRMQNEYNLPVNQYSRQIEGLLVNGLNPNLVYGGSSSVSGVAGSVSPYKLENFHSTSVPQFHGQSALQGILSTRLLQTQVAAQEANNRLLNARADNEEYRSPGIQAKSSEAAHRWQTISDSLIDNYDEAVRASLAKEYWTGVRSEYDAEQAQDKRVLSHYEAAMAEWLNTTEAPGTGMTYRQYMESCKAFLPGAQFDKFKADILDIASRMAFRAEQGKLIRLKQEFQGYVNYLAKYGRTLGNDWVTLLLSGLKQIFPNGFTFGIPNSWLPPEEPKDAYERGMAEHPAHNY